MANPKTDPLNSELDDSRVPDAPRPLVPANQATDLINNPQEQTGGKGSFDFHGSDISTQTLARLTKLNPCLSFFSWVAEGQYPAANTPQTRFKKHKDEHRRLYWVCLLLDLALTFVAALLLLMATAVTLYKTLWL